MNTNDKRIAVIGFIVIISIVTFGIWIECKRNAEFEQYATAHNCKWVWQGTNYGDNRDYICK